MNPDLKNGGNIIVMDCGHRSRFLDETLAADHRRGPLLLHHLQGDMPLEATVAGMKDGPHASLPEQVPERGTDQVAPVRRHAAADRGIRKPDSLRS